MKLPSYKTPRRSAHHQVSRVAYNFDKPAKLTTDQAIDLDKEVYAQGMANFLAPFFSTFAGSGSFNRSKANRSLGASTPLSGIVAFRALSAGRDRKSARLPMANSQAVCQLGRGAYGR